MSPSSECAAHPKWLNKSFFTDIVRRDYNTCKIIGFGVDVASGNGENYCSILYRVKVKVENDTNGIAHRSFMVKLNHETGCGVELARIMNVFPKEVAMYNELLPAFEQYYSLSGDNLKIGPTCNLAELEPQEKLVLEDLAPKGFRTGNRIIGLDMQHVEMVIEKLARFHAASAVHFAKVGEFDAVFEQGMINDKMSGGRDMTQYRAMVESFYKNLKCFPILEKAAIGAYADVLQKNVFLATRRSKDRFNVLCHGDLWTNNIMFRYTDEGVLQECVFVDYQMSYYSSPTLDLHYFMVTSMTKEDRLDKADYVLHFYHKHLVRSLRKLNYTQPIPKLIDLQKDFLSTGVFGVFTTLNVLPIVRAPASNASNLDNLIGETDTEAGLAMKQRVFKNPLYLDALEELIPHYHRKGYLEA